jgi:predicted TIM-barrel fold metal-dependent hydrolase
MSTAIVDAWIQHPAPGFLADPMFASLLRWMGVTEAPQDIPLEMTLAALEAAEIGTALTCAWHGPQGTLISNDFVAETVAASDGRLIGVASVDIRRPMAAVRELRRAVEELGFVALRLLPWLWELPPDDRRYYPLYAACIDLGIPFCLQAGHAGPLRPSEPGRPIPYLDRVACDFPDLKIVAGHIGFPWTTEMISLARKYENVYIDTSAYKPSRYPPELVQYMRKGGRKKVLFGSNYPMLPPAVCLSEVGALGLDDESTALFLGGNARRVFGLKPPSQTPDERFA